MEHIIKRPHITEKTLLLAARGWYTFVVDRKSRKEDTRKSIGLLYKVTVIDIRSVSMHGKMRKVGKMMKYSKKQDWKKVIVRLAKGQKIDAFEVTAPVEEKSAKSGSPAKGK
jgi:large subunit ribosomal protein L23